MLRLTIIAGLDRLHRQTSGSGSRAPRMFKQPRTPRLSVRPRETCPSITKASHQHQTHVLSSSHHSSAQRHSPFLPCSYYVRSRLARDGRACNYFNDALLPAVFRYPPCLALSHITCFSFIFFFLRRFHRRTRATVAVMVTVTAAVAVAVVLGRKSKGDLLTPARFPVACFHS